MERECRQIHTFLDSYIRGQYLMSVKACELFTGPNAKKENTSFNTICPCFLNGMFFSL